MTIKIAFLKTLHEVMVGAGIGVILFFILLAAKVAYGI